MGTRKPYEKPVIQSYGDVREITAQTIKEFGSSDGTFLFNLNNPLKDVC